MSTKQQTTYSVEATYIDGSMKPYIIYGNYSTTDKDVAESTANSLNEQYGKTISYKVIVIKKIKTKKNV